MLAAASSAYKHSLKVSPEHRGHMTVEAFGEGPKRLCRCVEGCHVERLPMLCYARCFVLTRYRYSTRARRLLQEARRRSAQPTCLPHVSMRDLVWTRTGTSPAHPAVCLPVAACVLPARCTQEVLTAPGISSRIKDTKAAREVGALQVSPATSSRRSGCSSSSSSSAYAVRRVCPEGGLEIPGRRQHALPC